MGGDKRRWWNRYIPAQTRNPVTLAWQLLTSPNPAARSALGMALAGVALAPLDILQLRSERRLVSSFGSPEYPITIVVGPPRSGTTLVAQYLINTFDVGYFNNLTSLFPKSPVTANRRFKPQPEFESGSYRAYYGKSRGMSGANDALYLWDRWLGSDRSAVPASLATPAEDMRKFFAAYESLLNKPLVCKVNRVNVCADIVVDALQRVNVICLRRDPLFLAQSLYVARQEIMGDLGTPYGTSHPDRVEDPIEDVCRQVRFFEEAAKAQQARIGPERFSIVSYEDFCNEPAALAKKLQSDNTSLKLRAPESGQQERFSVSANSKLPEFQLDAMRRHLRELGIVETKDP